MECALYAGWYACLLESNLTLNWLSQLGTAADDFLTGKRQLKMMTKVGGSGSVPASKSKTTKPTRRMSGPVVSVNRSKADDIFVDDDNTHDRPVAEISQHSVALDDIYDFGSSPPRPTVTRPTSNTSGQANNGPSGSSVRLTIGRNIRAMPI